MKLSMKHLIAAAVYGVIGMGLDSRVVIQRNEMKYDKPVPGDFEAVALVDEEDWQRFLKILKRRNRARITVAAVLEYAGDTVGRLSGDFVALNV